MSIAEATIKYQTRQWHVMNGRAIASYPPGQNGKRQAQLHALGINRPDLNHLVHRVCHQDPQAIDMALKTAAIIQTGLLYSNGACHSQSRPGVFHTVTHDGMPLAYHCSCEAFHYCPIHIEDIGFICKHALAAHWAYLLDIDLPQQPIPFGGEAECNTLNLDIIETEL